MAQTSEEKAKEIARLLNDFSFSAKGVAKELSREHRTLQQGMTRLAVAWLEVCASDNYVYDERNEASHLLAKELLDGRKLRPLPFI